MSDMKMEEMCLAQLEKDAGSRLLVPWIQAKGGLGPWAAFLGQQ